MGYASTQMEVMSVSAPKDKNQTRTINVVKVSDVAKGCCTVSSQFFIPPANISTFFSFFWYFVIDLQNETTQAVFLLFEFPCGNNVPS